MDESVDRVDQTSKTAGKEDTGGRAVRPPNALQHLEFVLLYRLNSPSPRRRGLGQDDVAHRVFILFFGHRGRRHLLDAGAFEKVAHFSVGAGESIKGGVVGLLLLDAEVEINGVWLRSRFGVVAVQKLFTPETESAVDEVEVQGTMLRYR